MNTGESMISKANIQNMANCLDTPYSTKLLSLYDKIQEFGMNIIGFSCNHDAFSFEYTTNKRNTFNYSELCQLQQILDPEATTIYSISVWGMLGVYTLKIKKLPFVVQ